MNSLKMHIAFWCMVIMLVMAPIASWFGWLK